MVIYLLCFPFVDHQMTGVVAVFGTRTTPSTVRRSPAGALVAPKAAVLRPGLHLEVRAPRSRQKDAATARCFLFLSFF